MTNQLRALNNITLLDLSSGSFSINFIFFCLSLVICFVLATVVLFSLFFFFSLPGHFPYKMCSRGHWRPSEDEKLKELVEKHGPHNWNVIAEKLPGRSGSIAINIEVLHLFAGKWLIYTQPFLYASSIFYLRYYKRSSLKKISYSKRRNNGCNVICRSFYYFSMEFYSKGDASLTWIICVFRFVI